MQTSNKIALGALAVSIISILMTGTIFLTRSSYDLDALKDAVGDSSKMSGLYAQIELAKKEALIAKTKAESSENISNKSWSIAQSAKETAESAKNTATSAEENTQKARSSSKDAVEIARGASKSANKAEADSQKALLNSVPIGTILPWIPTDIQPDIPAGWKICDGTKGTPDLKEKFLVGVRLLNESKKLGGRGDIPDEGNHRHGGQTTSVHANRITYKQGGDNNGVWFEHSHGIKEDGRHNHGGDNRPPFFTVIYIIKTS